VSRWVICVLTQASSSSHSRVGGDVADWPSAPIKLSPSNVRFRGKKQTSEFYRLMSAYGPKRHLVRRSDLVASRGHPALSEPRGSYDP
jgi:hypothetical protein